MDEGGIDSLSAVPQCSDESSVQLVEQITRDQLEDVYALLFGHGSGSEDIASELAGSSDIDLQAIRTTGRLNNGGRECAAQLIVQSEGAREVVEVTYTIELTDQRDEIYVTVYGL